MIPYADLYRKYEGHSVRPYTLPLYDNYFHDREEGVIWSSSYLSAIVYVVAYIWPQTEIDFTNIELTEDQMRVVELAKEIRKRRDLLKRHHGFCIDVPVYFYNMEMQKLKDQLASLDEIEPRLMDNQQDSICPGCEKVMAAGEKILHLPNGSDCCNYDCYAIILAKEHVHGH